MDENKIAHYEALIGEKLDVYLRKEYCDNGKTIKQISQESGIPESMVSKYKIMCGIPSRTKHETNFIKGRQLSAKLCIYCGAPIPLYREKKETCSHICARKYGKIKRHEEDNKRVHHCELCGSVVPNDRKSKRFCSNHCSVKWGHRNSPRPNSGHGISERTCLTCGNKFEVYNYILRKSGAGNFCSKACYDVSRRENVSLEQIKEAIITIYNKTNTLPTRDLLANYLGTTRKVIENRAGSLTNLYCSMGISTGRTVGGTGRTARILFALIDDLYDIRGVREKSFSNLRNPRTRSRLLLDYFLEAQQLAIEYQGEQHFHKVAFYGGEDADTQFNRAQLRDQIKREYCSDNDIVLLEWNYFTPISDENIHKYLDPIIKEGVRVPTLIKTE